MVVKKKVYSKAHHKNMSESSSLVPLFLFLLIFLSFQNNRFIKSTEAGQRRVRIPDELDDVIDDEEDEDWKKWGEKPKPTSDEFDPPNFDLPGMDIMQMKAEMLKKHVGPSFGFVKLRFGVRRSQDMVADIAMKWTKILKTGTIETKFMAVDSNTLMFTLDKGQDITELKEYVLSQPEAYEFKVGDHIFRRPGDPPLEQVMEKLRMEDAEEETQHEKEEL